MAFVMSHWKVLLSWCINDIERKLVLVASVMTSLNFLYCHFDLTQVLYCHFRRLVFSTACPCSRRRRMSSNPCQLWQFCKMHSNDLRLETVSSSSCHSFPPPPPHFPSSSFPSELTRPAARNGTTSGVHRHLNLSDATSPKTYLREGFRKKTEKVWSFAKHPSDPPLRFGLFYERK